MGTASETSQMVYSFTLVYAGVEDLTREVCDAIYEVGCDDALLGISNGLMTLDFDRLSSSFQEALMSAMRDVDRAKLPVRLVRVEPAEN